MRNYRAAPEATCSAFKWIVRKRFTTNYCGRVLYKQRIHKETSQPLWLILFIIILWLILADGLEGIIAV